MTRFKGSIEERADRMTYMVSRGIQGMTGAIKWLRGTLLWTATKIAFWGIFVAIVLMVVQFIMSLIFMRDLVDQEISFRESVNQYVTRESEITDVLSQNTGIAKDSGAYVIDAGTLYLTLLRHDDFGRLYYRKRLDAAGAIVHYAALSIPKDTPSHSELLTRKLIRLNAILASGTVNVSQLMWLSQNVPHLKEVLEHRLGQAIGNGDGINLEARAKSGNLTTEDFFELSHDYDASQRLVRKNYSFNLMDKAYFEATFAY